MSANIDSMLYVGETPWHGLGVSYIDPPETSDEIIRGAHLDWTVSAAPMNTDLHGHIDQYHAIYREDNQKVLGVVNRYPSIVQNVDTFRTFDNLLGSKVITDTAASLGNGEIVFGCFKLSDSYQIIDDQVDHYLVVMNDHLKPDGNVTILNTPIRVVCQNTLSAALSSAIYKARIPITTDVSLNETYVNKLFDCISSSISQLSTVADKMVNQKIDSQSREKIIDVLFPYLPDAGFNEKTELANARIGVLRDTFINCMKKDDLANYTGTAYQMFNAIIDFETHYFKRLDQVTNLNYRMKKLKGIGEGPILTTKFLSIKDKLVA